MTEEKNEKATQETLVRLAQPYLKGHLTKLLAWTIPFLAITVVLVLLQLISLSLGGLGLGVLGAIFLAGSSLPSREAISQIASTRYDGNPFLYAALIKNKKWARAGIVFLLVGFLFQGLALAIH